jgi:hypothetical protein
MRIFIKLKEMVLSNNELRLMIEKLEKKFVLQKVKNEKYEQQIKVIFKYIQELIRIEEKPKPKIGFHVDKD